MRAEDARAKCSKCGEVKKPLVIAHWSKGRGEGPKPEGRCPMCGVPSKILCSECA